MRGQTSPFRTLLTGRHTVALDTSTRLRGHACRAISDERVALEQSVRVRTAHEPPLSSRRHVNDFGFRKPSRSLFRCAATVME